MSEASFGGPRVAKVANEPGPDLRGALGKRILVVEDSPSARRLLQGLLLRLGVGLPDLRLAATVPEALQVFTRWTPEIAIIDLELRPGPPVDLGTEPDGTPRQYAANGAELAVQLLQREPGLKVIICSASEPNGTVLDPFLKSGRISSMMKPILASKVAEALARATKPPVRALAGRA
jgi:CheY-like chemotaxis protein